MTLPHIVNEMLENCNSPATQT